VSLWRLRKVDELVQRPAKCGMWQAGADSNTLAHDGTHIVKD
jgi:hypothetical protein